MSSKKKDKHHNSTLKITEESSLSTPRKIPEEPEDAENLILKDVITVSTLLSKSIDEQTENIMKAFNFNVSDSCFVFNAMPGRALSRVPTNCFLLGHRNQVTELCDPKGQRVALAIVDPLVTVKVIGTYEKTSAFFGQYGKFVLNVPAGYFAKATSQNKPVLFSEGPHVILDSTFQFDERTGFVSQIEPYISHSTMHILRVPAGKVAKAWLGTEPKILESRREPYVFNDPQFKLVVRDGVQHDKLSAYFYSATERFIEHGSIKRIIPHTGEVAITYNNGILDIIKPPKDGNPVIINSATHQFDGFISTSLQTILFPSEEAKAQILKDNPRASSDDRNLKIFQTRDSLRVGVVLVVAFRIKDPEMAITKLGKEGILPHIENIAFADMGKAIQLSTLQEVMYSSQNKPNMDDENHTLTIQDQVKKHLARDLEDCGIELARMNIETMKVLDEEIAKKLAGQSVTSAEFTTKQATLVKEYDIKTTEAKLKAETDNIIVHQKNQALIADAQARLESARREAEALLIQADAKRKAEEMRGELFTKYPQLFDLEMAKIRTDALKSATIFITPQDMGNIFNTPFGLTLFNQQNAPKK